MPPGCGPLEIAHEILHALGFIHEQNRFDRDRYIKLNPENIDSTKMANFEIMPEEFMEVSGLSEFSFDSIMIYPPSMFSTNGAPTMSPIIDGVRIAPNHALSERDISRLNQVYGSR
ncbi:MAG: M12 family metallopeptidase [Bdellovibrionota bacterium]